MIQITDKSRCCGCQACVQRCPHSCITMQADKEGFLYPSVDMEACVDCHLCEKVCPEIYPNEPKAPLQVLAAINRKESIRRQSSSGGIYTLLAERTIKKGGIVFGVRFDSQWNAKFDWTDSIEGLSVFRGSKYLQSQVGNTFQQVEHFLKDGKPVLFSGTPCQVAGLKHYLLKEYEQLLTVDFLCHGVPSPKVWQIYLAEQCRKLGFSVADIRVINFRNKDIGWKNYALQVEADGGKGFLIPFRENPYMRAFLKDLISRPSCSHCPSKSGRSGSDITIADYWGIDSILPQMDDDKGTGLVMINSLKGEEACADLDMVVHQTTLEDAKRKNGGFLDIIPPHPKRDNFFHRLDCSKSIIDLMNKNLRPPLLKRIKRRLRKMVGIGR